MGDSDRHPRHSDHPEVTIGPASRDTFRRGLWLLCKDLPPADRDGQLRRLLDHMRKCPPGTTGILQAQRGPEVVAAILWTTYPGRTAVISAPGMEEGESLETAEQLFYAIVSNLQSSHTRLIFANLSLSQTQFHDALRRCGFVPLARLLYLLSPAESFPHELEIPHLTFLPAGQFDPHQFARLVEETYVETLDCPELNGLRATEDVLAGYRATGVYSPEMWFVVEHQSEPAGCLILADHPDFDQLELVYMGLVPRYRGRGWGRDVVRYAQWMAHLRQRSGLLLAVDTRNTPALRVYESLGMEHLEEREIFLYILNDERGGQITRSG